MDEVDFLILGYGYTAKQLVLDIQKWQPSACIQTTSRRGEDKVLFDLMDVTTWKNLPKAKNLIWTFPPEPFEKVREFFDRQKNKYDIWTIVGSTSALQTTEPHEWVNESSLLKENIERVQSEKYLMEQGCRLVLSAGIYGPDKSPLQWIKKGWVGRSEKFVNMVHVEDLSQFLFKSLVYGKNGALYIASDNNPQKWQDIIAAWEAAGLLSKTPLQSTHKTSKRIDNSYSLKALSIELKHPSFVDAVIQMSPSRTL